MSSSTNRRVTGRHPNHNKRSKKRIPRTRTNINSRKAKNAQHEPTGKDITIRSSDAPWQVIYGQARVGGIITFVQPMGDWLHLIVTLSCHEIDSIAEMYVNEDKIVFGGSPDPRWATGGIRPNGTSTDLYANRVFMALNSGLESQGAIGDLVAISASQFPGMWTDDHAQRGLAHVYVILVYNNQAFPDGLPDLSFVINGKPVYDPRSATTYYTNNAALVIADYLMNTKFGCKMASSRIDMDQLSDAADICDEQIDLLNGSTESRYKIDTTFSVDETKQEILERMVTGMGGSITQVGGKWKIWPAAYITPTVTLTEKDLRSSVRIKTRASRRDNFNSVRGTYTSPLKKWQVSDFPPVTNNFYQTQDNGERVITEMKFPVTLTGAACQRLAKLELERIRQPIEVQATFGLKAFSLEVPENVLLTMPRYGWDAKPFEVIESELVLEEGGDAPELHVELLLRETASAVFDWNNGFETTIDPSPNSNLPGPFDAPFITGLLLESGTDQLYIRADGTVFSRIKVSWTPLNNGFINSNGSIQVQYKKSIDSEWNTATPVPGESSFTHILDVQDGVEYDVRVRTVNGLNIPGDWSLVSNHLVIGKTEPPSDVTGFTAQVGSFGILFRWDPIPDLDVARYELRLADETFVWEAASFVAEVTGTQYLIEVQPTQNYRYLIKAVDTSDNYSLNATGLNVGINAPSAVDIFHIISGENILLSWTQATGQFNIDEYEVRFGTEYNLSTFITRTKSTAILYKAAWSGNRRFWVTAIDVASNMGLPNYRDVQIYPPFAVTNLSAQVVDNNVLLRWTAAVGGTLGIENYRVLKGEALASAELIGTCAGTFSAIFEILSGTYVYWVVPVDIAGNVGQGASISAFVDQPPDFELLEDVILRPDRADTLDNIRIYFIPSPPIILPEPPIPGSIAPGTAVSPFPGFTKS